MEYYMVTATNHLLVESSGLAHGYHH